MVWTYIAWHLRVRKQLTTSVRLLISSMQSAYFEYWFAAIAWPVSVIILSLVVIVCLRLG